MRGRSLADPRHTPKAAPHGVTLMEVLLVLAILAMVAAFSFPIMEKSLANQRLRYAGDLIQAQWSKARVKAMDEGATHVFTFTPDTGSFSTRIWVGDEAAQSESQATDEDKPALMFAGGAGDSGSQLPVGVVFVSAQFAADSRADFMRAQNAPVDDEEPEAVVNQILFYPDGTTSTARLVLKNNHEKYLVVELRGLTGVARASAVRTADEMIE